MNQEVRFVRAKHRGTAVGANVFLFVSKDSYLSQDVRLV